VPDGEAQFIAMFDINKADDPINSGYIWLPLEFSENKPAIQWRSEWNTSVFENQ